MEDFNKFIATGRLGKDPESRVLADVLGSRREALAAAARAGRS